MSDYEKGMQDCKDGKPHSAGMSNEYNEGYSQQYTIEAQQSRGFN
jgi:hypothetical protein